MRFQDLRHYRAQIDKCRDLLQDHVNPSDKIARPPQMRVIQYNKLIARVQRNEKYTVQILEKSLNTWLDRVYKA
jgi:hypothetical protein